MTEAQIARKTRLIRELEARIEDRDPLPEDYRRDGARWLIGYTRQIAEARAELAAAGIAEGAIA
jgi:hypothetical protein